MRTVKAASLVAGIVAASIAAVATPTQAQFQKRTIEVGLQGGASLDTRHTDHGLGIISRSLAYSVTDLAQIGVRLGEAIDRSGGFRSLFRAEANVLMPRTGALIPYVGAHCSALLRYDDGVAATGLYGLQAGGKFPVTDKFAVSLEVGYSLPMTGPQTSSVSMHAGLIWLFPPPPKTPAD